MLTEIEPSLHPQGGEYLATPDEYYRPRYDSDCDQSEIFPVDPMAIDGDRLDAITSMTVWPSGDTSIGRPPPRPKPTDDPEEDTAAPSTYIDPITGQSKQLTAWTEAEIERWADWITALWEQGRTHEAGILLEKVSRETERSTGLSGVLNSHKAKIESLKPPETKERRRRGSNGITGYGKKMLRSAAAIFEERHDRRLVTFSTLTLPALEPDELVNVCENWAEITRQMYQELGRELDRQGLPREYFGCSEVQPKRWEESREVAPHLHFCYVGRHHRKQAWLIDKVWMRKTWARILESFVGHEIEKSALENCQGVVKSLKCELGKYLSKGGKMIREIEAEGRSEELPSAYWNCTLELKREIKERVKKIKGVAASLWMQNWQTLNRSGIGNFRQVWARFFDPKQGREVEIPIGLSGWVSVSNWEDFVCESAQELEEKIWAFQYRDF